MSAPSTAPSVAAGQTANAALIYPGKPWQNGATESLIGKFRDECLSLEWFRSRTEAKVVIETWRRHYNEVRPHSSLGYLTPAEFVARIEQQDAASRPATGRTAAVCGASALRPVASPSRKGQAKDQTEGGVLKLSVARRNRAGQANDDSPTSFCRYGWRIECELIASVCLGDRRTSRLR